MRLISTILTIIHLLLIFVCPIHSSDSFIKNEKYNTNERKPQNYNFLTVPEHYEEEESLTTSIRSSMSFSPRSRSSDKTTSEENKNGQHQQEQSRKNNFVSTPERKFSFETSTLTMGSMQSSFKSRSSDQSDKDAQKKNEVIYELRIDSPLISARSYTHPRTRLCPIRKKINYADILQNALKEKKQKKMAICLNNEKVKQYMKGFTPLNYLILYSLLKLDMTDEEFSLFNQIFYLQKVFYTTFQWEPWIDLYFYTTLWEPFELPEFFESIRLELLPPTVVTSRNWHLTFYPGEPFANEIKVNTEGVFVNKKTGGKASTDRPKFEKIYYKHIEVTFILKDKTELELWKSENLRRKKTTFELHFKKFHISCCNEVGISFFTFYLQDFKLKKDSKKQKDLKKQQCIII